MPSLLDVLLVLVGAEALTELVGKSELFQKFRWWAGEKHQMLETLVNCPMCLSGQFALWLWLLTAWDVHMVVGLWGTAWRGSHFLHDVLDWAATLKWRPKNNQLDNKDEES